MASKLDEVHANLTEEFSAPGGHVEWTSEFFDAASASSAAVLLVPGLIEWVLRHKGINIVAGNVTVGHRTVEHWHIENIPFIGKKKIPEPNRFIGFAGWKP